MFLIPAIFLVGILLLYWRSNQKQFGPVSLVISVYLVSQLLAIPLYLFFGYDERSDVHFEPMLFLSTCFCLVFGSLAAFKDGQNRMLIIQNVAMLRALEKLQVVTSVFAIIYFLPLAIDALSGSVAENRLNLEVREQAFGTFGLINSMASLFANMFTISVILAFINLASIGNGGSRTRAQILLALSSVYIIYIFAYVGRDGFVYWTMTFAFVYLFFRNYIPATEKAAVKKLALVVLVPSAVFFVVVTFARFSVDEYSSQFTEEFSVLTSMLEYGGGQVFNFNDHYLVDAPTMMGRISFMQALELWATISGGEPPRLDRLEFFRYYTDVGVQPWVFTTFIGTFLHDFGPAGTVIALATGALLIRLTLRQHRTAGALTFTQLLIFFLLCQIVFWGVFYYRQYTGLYYQFAVLLLAGAFKVFASPDQALKLVSKARS